MLKRTQQELNENYAVIELMGHQRMIGRYSEITIAGKGFLRVALLDKDGNVIRTRDINPDSVYAINPISKETCLLECGRMQQEVAVPYDLEQIIRKRLTAGANAKDAETKEIDPEFEQNLDHDYDEMDDL